MSEEAQAIAALVAAVEQRLLVAVLQRDEAAVLTARSEVARLKRLVPPAQRNADGPPAESASLETCGQPGR